MLGKVNRWAREHVTTVYNLLFAITLITLVVLSGWWYILHLRQVDSMHEDRAKMLRLQTMIVAMRLGHESSPPDLKHSTVYELLPSDRVNAKDGSFSLAPNWPDVSIRTRPVILHNIEQRHQRRLFMIGGEGALLFFLILVCVFMLYRLLLSERKARTEMEIFFQAVSHELKTPIAGVRALLDTLASHEVSSTDLQRYAALGLRETSRLQKLVENVLLANRIDRRIFSAKPREVEIVAWLKDTLARRNRIFSHEHASLSIDCDDDTIVLADPDLFRMVIENLIDNAYKYGASSKGVKLRLRGDAEWCMINVQDDGTGFEPEQAERLFDKFHRGAESADTEGSGLGLFIARSLIQAFGGSLTANSAGSGKGSIFKIALKRIR